MLRLVRPCSYALALGLCLVFREVSAPLITWCLRAPLLYIGGAKKKEKKKKETSKLSNTYTNKMDKKASTPYLLKKKKNDKVVAIKVNSKLTIGSNAFGCRRKSSPT